MVPIQAMGFGRLTPIERLQPRSASTPLSGRSVEAALFNARARVFEERGLTMQ